MTVTSPDFTKNVQFQHELMPQVEYLLRKNARHMINFVLSSKEEDQRRATDMVMRVDSGTTIAVRCRRYAPPIPNKPIKRDLTIRSVSLNKGITELTKIRDQGFGDWYLYAWADPRNILDEWLLVDLQKLRSSGLLASKRFDIPNGDGTKFRAYDMPELLGVDCVKAVHIIRGKYRYNIELEPEMVILDVPAHLRPAALLEGKAA